MFLSLASCQQTKPVGVSISAQGVIFPPPELVSISPLTSLQIGGGTLSLTGTKFVRGASVIVGGASCGAVQFIDTNSITCSLPANNEGFLDVTITNPDGNSSTLYGAIQYMPKPILTAMSLQHGTQAGGNTIIIDGLNFQSGIQIAIGGTNCSTTNFINATQISCITPAKTSGTYNLVVTNPDTQVTTAYNVYTYDPAPQISAISPIGGKAIGHNIATITGTNFVNGATIKIGSTDCLTVTFNSSTQLLCTIPAQTSGVYDVVVQNPDAQIGTLVGGYEYNPPLSVSSRSPAFGKLSGGDLITFQGNGFYSGSTVTINNIACSNISYISLHKITCNVPASGSYGNYDIVVTSTTGEVVTLTGNYGYTYSPPPTLTSISPANGKIAGGTSMTLTGTGFLGGASATIGGTSCSNPNLVSSTTMTCTIPTHLASTYDVQIINSDSQSATLTNAYTYNAQPVISSVTPNNGILAGGTTVTITGSGFMSGATATIGGTNCTSLSVVSNTSITCTLPAKTAGAYNVVVTNVDTQTVTLTNGYTYNAFPTITSVSPTNGKLAAGTTITLTGTGFISGATVTLGGTTCTSPTWISSTSITCITPAATASVASLVINNPDSQSGSLANAFTYNPLPTIISVSSSNGKLAGATTLTITGTGFMTSATASIGGTNCTLSTVVSSTSITCTLPSKTAGTYNVVVTNADTQAATLTSAYTYNAFPTITSVSPTNGKLTAGTTITIAGTGFLTGATITVGGTACTVPTVASSTSMTCIAPTSTAGLKTLVVTNLDTQTGTLSNSYTYNAAPVVNSILPTNGIMSGGTTISILGSGFLSAASVSIGGTNCTSITVVSPTNITCITAATTQGTYSLTVSNTDTQSSTLASAFTFNPFTLTSISPTSGPLIGGTTLTITGNGLVSGATATIGGTDCTSPNVSSSTTMTCIIPTKIAGAYNLVITNPDTSFATLSSAYTYRAFPTITTVSPSSGKLAAGTQITLTGTGFITGSSVTVGGVACTAYVYTSATSMKCSTPSMVAGTYDVVFTNSDTQSVTKTNGFTYNPFPTAASISPTSGKASGGTTITITGTGFVTGATVTVGGTTCTTPTVTNSTTMTCVTPVKAGSTTYNVVVTNADTQSVTLTNVYTANLGPTVTSISPTSGTMVGGTTITLTGTNFISGATITVGGTTCTSPTWISSTSMTCVTPAKAVGVNSIVLTNPDTQISTLANSYTYTTFSLMSVAPTNGNLSGGTLITLAGTGFVTGATVTVGGTACTSPTVLNSSSITCNTPAKTAAIYSIVITNGDGATNTLTNSYTYNPNPTLTSISPSNGPPAGGTTITLTGTGFLSGATVSVGGSTCTSPTVVSATSITCVSPAHAAGTGSVVITNSDTQSATLSNAFTFNASLSVTAISPTSGSKKGGVSATITGTGFLTGAIVTIGGATCTSTTVVSSTSITCTTPAGVNGANAIVNVTNTDSQTSNYTGFTFVDATDAATSTLAASATMAPSDGLASVRIFVVPKNDGSVLRGTGRNIEISVSSSNVTLSGGSACSTPSTTCMLASEVAPGVYSVTAKASTSVAAAIFTAIARETPAITLTQTTTVNFNTANFSVISSNSTITSSSANLNLYFTGGTSSFDASTVGVSFGHLFVKGATIQHLATTNSQIRRLDISVSSLTLLSGGSIDVSGLGYLSGPMGSNGVGVNGDSYSGNSSPSQSLSSLEFAGASHGGKGGYSSYGLSTDPATEYDDYMNPYYPGGGVFGVGVTYAGGGVARITATQYCTINSGASIKANASATNGNAGGSIYLNCAGITGDADASSITANGGSAVDWAVSGGGGGRIALISSGDQTSFSNNFTYPYNSLSLATVKNVIKAQGGAATNASFPAGGAGTIYLKNSAETYGDMIIDNGKTSTVSNDGGTNFLTTTSYHLNHLDIAGYSKVTLNANLTLDTCDLHSVAATTFNVPTGSVLNGNTFTSSSCLNASVTTKGTTVKFTTYSLP